jgi:lipooligosaccharide transport system permease protein
VSAGTAAIPRRAPGRLRRRLHRLEPAAIAGVMSRDITNFKTFWKTTTFSSVLDPTIYLLAFGLGFSATLISDVDGLDYVFFLGTGMVGTAVLFSSVFSAMYGVFVKHRFQRTYDAILAAPVDVEELATAEVLWLSVRAGVYGGAPLLVTMVLGLDPAWGMLTVPFIGAITGFGFAALGVFAAAAVAKIDHFNYIQSALITPLFLVSGTFFPIDQLPEGVQIASNFNPLYHCVELVRHAVLTSFEVSDLARVGALLLFGFVTWRLAVWRLQKRLIE